VIAIGWALAQRGTPYSYGGDCTAAHSGIAAHRCDCSSLVQTAYRAASVSLPRTTTEQVRVGVPVADLSQVRPGDLVFIPGSDGTVDAPGHVALCIGNGVAVHAPHRGEVVRLVRVADWRSVIVSVRRLVSWDVESGDPPFGGYGRVVPTGRGVACSHGCVAVAGRRGPSRTGRGEVAGSSPRLSIRYDCDARATVDLDQARVTHLAGSVPWRRWRPLYCSSQSSIAS
jgi:hypothetical protein